MYFSEKTIDFLAENYMHNSKTWFSEHKSEYEKYVKSPFAYLVEYLKPVMFDIDSDIICSLRSISRIYKDIRFSKGGSVFRDSLWISLRRRRERFQCVPEFYFYVGTNGFGWGCGYYHASAQSMESIRSLILAGDKSFKAAKKAFEGLDEGYELWGDSYKRDHYPDQSRDLGLWLNKKTICISTDRTDADLLFSDRLAETLKNEFVKLKPVYDFYIKAEEDRISRGK